MLNREREFTYITSTDEEVENGDFGKNVGVAIGTKKIETRFVEEQTEQTEQTEQPVPEGE